MVNNGQKRATMANNWQQRTTTGNNGQQWATMDNNPWYYMHLWCPFWFHEITLYHFCMNMPYILLSNWLKLWNSTNSVSQANIWVGFNLHFNSILGSIKIGKKENILVKLGNYFNLLKKAKWGTRRSNQICRVKNFYNSLRLFISLLMKWRFYKRG